MLAFCQLDPDCPPGLFAALLAEWGVPHQTVAAGTLPDLPRLRGLIVLGGAMGVGDEAEHPFLREVKRLLRQACARDLPVLGICLGGQLLAEACGGTVTSRSRGEQGVITVERTAAGRDDPLFQGFPGSFAAFAWHNDSFSLPPGALHLAATAVCPIQAFRCGRAWGLQFHPEVDEAIVTAWTAKVTEGAVPLAQFRARQAALQSPAQTLLANFVALCGAGQPPGSRRDAAAFPGRMP